MIYEEELFIKRVVLNFGKTKKLKYFVNNTTLICSRVYNKDTEKTFLRWKKSGILKQLGVENSPVFNSVKSVNVTRTFYIEYLKLFDDIELRLDNMFNYLYLNNFIRRVSATKYIKIPEIKSIISKCFVLNKNVLKPKAEEDKINFLNSCLNEFEILKIFLNYTEQEISEIENKIKNNKEEFLKSLCDNQEYYLEKNKKRFDNFNIETMNKIKMFMVKNSYLTIDVNKTGKLSYLTKRYGNEKTCTPGKKDIEHVQSIIEKLNVEFKDFEKPIKYNSEFIDEFVLLNFEF